MADKKMALQSFTWQLPPLISSTKMPLQLVTWHLPSLMTSTKMVLQLVTWQLSSLIWPHYSDVIMSAMASQITGVSIVCRTVCSGADHRKHQSSASLAFVRGSTGDRWIPLTKIQWRGKCFHLMTSSWTCWPVRWGSWSSAFQWIQCKRWLPMITPTIPIGHEFTCPCRDLRPSDTYMRR